MADDFLTDADELLAPPVAYIIQQGPRRQEPIDALDIDEVAGDGPGGFLVAAGEDWRRSRGIEGARGSGEEEKRERRVDIAAPAAVLALFFDNDRCPFPVPIVLAELFDAAEVAGFLEGVEGVEKVLAGSHEVVEVFRDPGVSRVQGLLAVRLQPGVAVAAFQSA